MAAHIIRGRMRRALTLLAAVTLAGCGGGDSGDSGEAATTVPAGGKLSVSAKEYSFTPKTIVARAGGPHPLELTNDGAQAHDIQIRNKDGQSFGGTPVFGPNQSQSTILRLSPGEYEFFCSVGDHEQLGMKGTLTVK
jgi:plastocyanin